MVSLGYFRVNEQDHKKIHAVIVFRFNWGRRRILRRTLIVNTSLGILLTTGFGRLFSSVLLL